MKLNVPAIKRLMATKQLRQSDLAELAGVTRQSVSTFLTRGTYSIINAGRLAQALEVDLDVIAEL